MYFNPNRYAELHLAGMQSLIAVAHAQLAALASLSALNLGVARSTFYGSLAAVGIKPDQRAQAGAANQRPPTRGKDRKAA